MWVRRADYERDRAEWDRMVAELAAERGRRHQLELEVARMTQRDDWLMVRVNSLETERQALFERFMQVAYAAPIIERSNEIRPQPASGPVGRPITDYPLEPSTPSPAARPAVRMPVMAPEPPRGTHPVVAAAAKLAGTDDPASAISVLQASGAAFEDMGNEAAATLGVGWDEFGNVQHAPGA
jgi:hypothetical protein